MKKTNEPNRREFLKKSGMLAAGAIGFPYFVPASALGAEGAAPSERITLGFVGLGMQGRGLLGSFLNTPAQVLAICDVDALKMERSLTRAKNHYADKSGRTGFPAVEGYRDFREVIGRDDIDAVVIATPDHWHATIAVQAMEAGKHVYCEKPLANCIAESRAIVEAANRYGRIFQTGSMQRSWRQFRLACELVRNESIGKLKQVKVCSFGPPMFCNLPAEPVPDYLDWDLWLGPAPQRPYNSELSPHISFNSYPNWRGYWDYGGGSMTDLGAHMFDIAHWAMDMDRTGPVEIHPPDGKEYKVLTYRYANGMTMTMESIPRGFGALFIGDRGKVEVNREGLYAEPEQLARTQFGRDAIRLYPSNDHQDNFLDCIRRRTPCICDAETGHRTATVCHLSNIALRLGRSLRWDPAAERFVNDPQADRFLKNPMRSPWQV
jgi:predicted dehydrogenase